VRAPHTKPAIRRRVQLLTDLESGGALTAWQARRLADHWDSLPDDWASHPYCRQVREHARAYIDRERRLGASRSNPQQKE
jgi:hypothetical protein